MFLGKRQNTKLHQKGVIVRSALDMIFQKCILRLLWLENISCRTIAGTNIAIQDILHYCTSSC
jgi:hypothetical protein